MKKYILLSLSAFILACLIGGGIVWRLETKGKIKFKWNPETDNQALTLDRLIRELIPDSGQIYGKWEVLARQEDPVDWEYENSQENYFNPRIGTVKLVGNNSKPIPGHWDILLKTGNYWRSNKANRREWGGYKLFSISHDSVFNIGPQVFPVKLQEGEQAELLPLKKGQRLPFVNKKAHYELYSVQLKGKAPAQLLIEWPGENNEYTFSIYGEAADTEELWNYDDDIFRYSDLLNRGEHIQPPLGFIPGGHRYLNGTIARNDDLIYIDEFLYLDKREYSTHIDIVCTEKNGTITDINITPYYYSDDEWEKEKIREFIEREKENIIKVAQQFLKDMSKVTPGKIKGKPIRVAGLPVKWSTK